MCSAHFPEADVSRAVVFMFSGQGAQFYGMGRELLEHPVFARHMHEQDSIVRRTLGRSVLEHLYDRTRTRSEPFDDTLLTHPANFMYQYALAEVLQHEGVRPTAILGASLGEFVAVAVARALGRDATLAAVVAQALAVARACEPGGMIAIRGDEHTLLAEPALARLELAAVNFPGQFVLSGRKTDIVAATGWLVRRGIWHYALPVRHPWHSRWLDAAAADQQAALAKVQLVAGEVPVFSSCRDESNVAGPQLWNAVRLPTKFAAAVANLPFEAPQCIDLGPTGTLANFIKYNPLLEQRVGCSALASPFGTSIDLVRRTAEALTS
jgi:acyl transferase domain-containing protein